MCGGNGLRARDTYTVPQDGLNFKLRLKYHLVWPNYRKFEPVYVKTQRAVVDNSKEDKALSYFDIELLVVDAAR